MKNVIFSNLSKNFYEGSYPKFIFHLKKIVRPEYIEAKIFRENIYYSP